MREIKFRFWDGQYMLTQGFHVSAPGTVWGWVDHSCKNSFEMKGITMQSTGLRDKNGVDIYEGDIVTYKSHTGQVIYQQYICKFILQLLSKGQPYTNWLQYDYMIKDGEVIGDIYSNPELIQTYAIKEQDIED